MIKELFVTSPASGFDALKSVKGRPGASSGGVDYINERLAVK